jgi:hypothetical protein
MKYALAVLACFGVCVAYVLIGVALGWHAGGGVVPMTILFVAIGAIWRSIRKKKISENTNSANGIKPIETENSELDSASKTCENEVTESLLEDEAEEELETRTVFQGEMALEESENKKPIVASERAKWIFFACLLVILVLAVLRVVPLPLLGSAKENTRGNGPVLRDLSTPSKRLVGLWRNVDNGHELYYAHFDPSLQIGTFTWSLQKNTYFGRFRVLSESSSGEQLQAREFVRSDTAKFFSADVAYCLPRDGQSMTKEYVLDDGQHVLLVYRYVEHRLIPEE